MVSSYSHFYAILSSLHLSLFAEPEQLHKSVSAKLASPDSVREYSSKERIPFSLPPPKGVGERSS